MEDPVSLVFPEQSTDSLSSVLAMIRRHHATNQPTGSVSSVQAMIQGNLYPPNQTHLNSPQSPSKQPKYSPVFEAPNEDLFSTLPDSLLQEILCFLAIEDAIKTSLLSRRWRSLWTQMPTLSFTREYFAVKHAKRAEFVNETLRRFTGPKIKNFLINLKFHDSMNVSLEEWVLFATTHRVEKLSLIFDGGFLYAPFAESKPFSLPQFLYLSWSLKDLILRQCVVLPTRQVSWPRLKVLSINYSRLTSEAIENVLSGSPNLQKLKLHNCGGVNRICSMSLETLEVDAIYELHEKNESVTGFHVRISVIEPLRVYVQKNIQGFINMGNKKGMSSPLSKCHCLVLDTEICEWDIPGIVSLLQSSPYLKKLVINLYCFDNSKFEFDQSFFDSYEFDGVEFLASTNWIFKCFLQSMEDIELAGFQQSSSGSRFLVKFMKFLFSNAKVLKKVAIYEQSGALHKSWKFSGPNMNMELESTKRNQIILKLSSGIPLNAVSQ
ncbi:hypothetical protein V6N13_139217 [Hibiscus sabdariffa]